MKKSLLFVVSLVLLSASSALAIKIKPGHWHTEFQLRSGVNLPVDMYYEVGKPPIISVQNGEEKITLSNVRTSNDTIYASFPAFNSNLIIKVQSKTAVVGSWYNKAKSETYHVDFWSKLSEAPRFPATNTYSKTDGKWEVTFSYLTEPEKAVGIFDYTGVNNVLKGTFLTETGDYRFLEGASIGDSLYLSCFDGSHAFLFRAKLKQDTLWGDFHSGNHFRTEWYAVKNNSFELRHPDSITYVVNENPLKFDLMEVDGSVYHYPNKFTEGKVVLIQLMGTWCPNCLDESKYLKEIYAKYEDQLEIIAVTFETQVSDQDKIDHIRQYQQTLGLYYTFLIGGDACKPCAAKIFPQLNNIISFPTLIFVDKKGEIRKIHTGFNGPGTGDIYTKFVKETDVFISTLVNE